MTELSLPASRPQSDLKLRPSKCALSETRTHESTASALRCLLFLLGLIALAPIAWAQTSPPSTSHPVNPYTIKVDVDVVVLRATALARNNSLVAGLSKESFQVYEDGVMQQITYFSHDDIPVTVGLVIDNSGSMRPRSPDVIAAALLFARSSNPLDQMFVVGFNEKVWFGLPDNIPFTDQAAQLEAALSRNKPDGQTALYDAVAAALDHLKMGSRDKKVLIVVSDGGDNASKHKLNQIVEMAAQSEAIVYTIGIFDEQDGDQNPEVLRRIAKDTGGEAFLPESLKEIAPICERIARDIRNQYTIAYVPTNRKRDGTYRSIQVKASGLKRGRLSVRTRTGYFASPATPASATKASVHEVPD